jgi:hypothetical protein
VCICSKFDYTTSTPTYSIMVEEWEGIVDQSKVIQPVWFSRIRGDAKNILSSPAENDAGRNNSSETASHISSSGRGPPWAPLRNIDNRALNDSDRSSDTVQIEGGRATVHAKERRISFNFYNLNDRELLPSAWFVTTGSGKGPQSAMVPLSEKECDKIEALYQTAVSAFDSGEDSVKKQVLQHEVDVDGKDGSPSYVIFVAMNKSTNTISIRRRPKSSKLAQVFSFGGDSSVLLQRGYGEYVVDGEEEEVALGPVRHLIFVVHGIGEAMWSRSDVNVNGIVDEVNHVRTMMHKRQVEMWKRECLKAEQQGTPGPSPPNRIELLPILWYDKIHSSSGHLKKTLQATTIKSIPALRSIANDVIFDVLMYMTPEFCQQVLTCVTEQICNLYKKFRDCHPFFVSHGGKCSLVGHSLGSVIIWDLLSVLKRKQEDDKSGQSREVSCAGIASNIMDGLCVSQFSSAPPDLLSSEDNTYMPTLKRPMESALPFMPDSVFLLGSPLGLFLTLRGANTIFESLRERSCDKDTIQASAISKSEAESSSETQVTELPAEAATQPQDLKPRCLDVERDVSPFVLPCGALFNIFNPSDPVAYRIEPLLVSPDVDEATIPQPAYLKTRESGIRPHVALKKLGDDLHKFAAGGSAMMGSMLFSAGDSIRRSLLETAQPVPQPSSDAIAFPLGGRSSRVDYQLQWSMMDNEYLSAVSAHSTYFSNSDVIDFMIETVMDPTGEVQSFTINNGDR